MASIQLNALRIALSPSLKGPCPYTCGMNIADLRKSYE
jgi:hypothetical protein